MKRILILSVIALALFSSAISLAQNKLPKRVPKGKTYVYLDNNNTELARRTAGKAARVKGIIDCAQIPCPPTFPADAVCWKCVKRPTTATTR